MRPSALSRTLFALALVVVLFAGGCARNSQQEPVLQPKVSPPAIAEKGTLRVGVDLGYPPFGGVDKGKQAGIDVDIARALSTALGLKLELVSVVPSEAASALDAKRADVVLSVPFTADALAGSSLAGSYISDGPAFFATTDGTTTIDSIGSRVVGVQTASEASWLLEEALGPGVVQQFPTLREALQALASGKVELVAGDAIVGAYIARDLTAVRFAGQLGAARTIGAAVAKDNVALGDNVRTALDDLAAKGALSSMRRAWVGDLPEIEANSEQAAQ